MLALKEFEKYVLEYFKNNNWTVCYCSACGRIFLSKNYKCNCGCKNLYELQPVKKQKTSISEFKETSESYFLKKGYIKTCFDNIKNENKDTAFVVAAIQIYNESLYKGNTPNKSKIFCPQPCIRLKQATPLNDGCLRAFINIATLKIDADINTYLNYVDDWIGFLSKLGIHASRLSIVISNTEAKINNLYHGWNIDIMYNDLELGHCAYYYDINSTNIHYTGIDCGFCTERILWVLNGSDFFYSILPKDLIMNHSKFNREHEDILRSIVLIVMSGILPGANNEHFQLKKLLILFFSLNYNWLLLDYNIEYYYKYWYDFLITKITLDECKRIIYKSIRNIYLSKGKFIDE